MVQKNLHHFTGIDHLGFSIFGGRSRYIQHTMVRSRPRCCFLESKRSGRSDLFLVLIANSS
jgi:hypothetical protein